MLELRDVYKRYSSGREIVAAVDGVTLTVADGELLALYGPSGSGKTTLLMIAAGISPPDSGSVLCGGLDISGFDRREGELYRRRTVGFVYQTFHLHPGLSALDNAAVKLVADGVAPRRARSQVAPLMRRLGLEDRARHRPSELSGGERQRVAIARALANDPRVLLADEPTGNLDSRRGLAILELLAEVARERRIPVLLATHDPEAARIADRSLALHDGRVAGAVRWTPGADVVLEAEAP